MARNVARNGGSAIHGRTAHHAGYRDQPAEAQARRRLPRVAEDSGHDAQGAAELERMLDGSGFRRINRGTLVNLEHVRELIPWFSGTYRVKLATGLELEVSRDRARQLTQGMGV